MKRAVLMAAAMVCGLAGLWRSAEAGPLDSRIPADAVVYVGWAGADALTEKYLASHLKAIVDNTKIGDYVRDNWNDWLQKAHLPGGDEAAKNLADAFLGLNLAWRHPTALYIGPLGLKDPKNPTFKLAFLCDAGADAPALKDLLKRVIAKNPPPPEAKLHIGGDGSLVALTLGEVTPEDFAVPAGKPQIAAGLAGAPGYVAAMRGLPKDPAVALYVDVEQILNTVGEGLDKDPTAPEQMKKTFPAVLQAVGLTSVTQFSYAGGFDGKDWSEAAFLGIRGQHTGFLSLLDVGPVSDAALAMVPKDAVSMSVGRVDLSKAMAIVRDIISQGDADALKQFDKGMAEGNKQLGFDIQKDVIDALGDEWVSYRGPAGDDGGHPFVIVQKLRDPDSFAKALAAMESKFNEAAQGKVKIEKIDTGKFEASGIRLPAVVAGMPAGFAWTIRGGIFYISTIDGLGPAVDQVEQKGESITANAGYKAVRAALPNVKANSITYSEPAKLYPEVYRTLMGLLPLGRLVGMDIPGDLIPNPKRVAAEMPPGGSISWTDAEGFHFAARSAFPGAQMLSGQASPPATMGLTAMGVSVLLPSLAKAREQAKQTVDMSNMRAMGQLCIIYAAEHDDKYPDRLATLEIEFRTTIETPATPLAFGKVLVSARGSTIPLQMTAKLADESKTDFAGFAKEVDAHSDYVYLGHGLKSGDFAGDVVLLYEKPASYTNKGIPLLFADNHVEFCSWNDLTTEFKETNKFLKAHDLPQVDVDALLKDAPIAR